MESAYAAAIEAAYATESAKRRRLPHWTSTPAPVRPRPNPTPSPTTGAGVSSTDPAAMEFAYAVAIEAAYAAESAKRRRLPDWTSAPSPLRPRPNPTPSPTTGAGESSTDPDAMEFAYAAAYVAESAKRRRLPDWTTSTLAPVRPRPNPVPAAGGASSPSWVLSPPTCQGNVQARHEQVAFSGKIVYCRTPSEVEKATREIVLKIESMKASGQVSLGFDLEWKPFPRRGEPPCKVALMQLCMDKTHCYVMHIIHSGVPPILKSLLEDSSTVKVGVCIDNDARKMFNGYNVRVQPLMDLSTVANAKLAGPHKRWSLAALTEMITCKELPKPGNIRMGNWEAYVLSKQQLQYAATDAYISWYLYEVLRSLPDYNVEIEAEIV